MSLFNIFQIASQGMTVQRQRLEAAAGNLANSETTRTPEGGAYKRRDVILESAQLDRPSFSTFDSTFDTALAEQTPLQGVRGTTVIADSDTGARRYDPGHPDADASGYVTMPDVEPLEETINMLSAARSFEANSTAFNTAKEMARASLRLGDA